MINWTLFFLNITLVTCLSQKSIQLKPSGDTTLFEKKIWPFKRSHSGLSSGVEIYTFMFRFSLSRGLTRGVDLL